MTVVAEVCSVYEERNESLINAGVLALSRETGDFPGVAQVRDHIRKDWVVNRVSQEHGVLTYVGKDNRKATQDFCVGAKVELDVQHTCIVGAMYGWHYITDEEGIVTDVDFPCKWW
ncbi:hypothetical protein K461DRAFT_153590 [Myriangium duriaei CBS 260.36]|uniref:D-serine dehydratase-like domain-containing protein n=1 Tax=Myriangium duriaei CBS 260.36 TaxID=1168546 RepID=A0A9P4J166_9PEZI|nr:hypothetical protein K461DRAFT_153590 [Myriangium duriaei CBS 260.36]